MSNKNIKSVEFILKSITDTKGDTKQLSYTCK